MTDSRAIRDLRDRLLAEHADVMRRLHQRLALDRELGPFGELDESSKDHLIDEAAKMCAAWEKDAALRESHVAGQSEVVDLVAKQHQLAQQIHAAEGRKNGGIGGFAEARL
ncbi:hypothetical protein [Terrarubrum flagellatum]|uniref:hypothetical protein n=1 Tax=Terrirubrum flagellatum TaxID=2895980 RepID=UPI0031452010